MQSDNEVRLHHYGLLLPDEADFAQFRTGLLEQGVNFQFESDTGAARALYADYRSEPGLYLEHVQFERQGQEWLTTVPGN